MRILALALTLALTLTGVDLLGAPRVGLVQTVHYVERQHVPEDADACGTEIGREVRGGL